MKIKLYQINCIVDGECKNEELMKRAVQRKFLGLDALRKLYGSADIDPQMYALVYDGEVDAEDLETVYQIFNVGERPAGFTGHSMSVSDIVQVMTDTTQTLHGVYFCDSIGFKRLPLGVAEVKKHA